MSKINLHIGATVFFENEEYTITSILDFVKVTIKNILSSEVKAVYVDQLHSKLKKENDEKTYIDNFSDNEWKIANKKYQIIKDLVFKSRTRNEVKAIAKKHNKSPTTIYKWIAIYEHTEEITALVPKTAKRGRKGSRLDETVEIIMNQVLEDLYLNKQRNGFRKIYSKISRECAKSNLTAPHENTVRNRIEEINPKVAIKARDGHKAAAKQFDNFEGEFPEGNYPLEVIQIDHTPLDIFVVDKIYRKPLEKRPFITLAIDVYSRMITGFYISLQAPGYFNVSQCLLNSFVRKDEFLKQQKVDGDWQVYGIPRIIHVDNGADLVSSDMQRVCDGVVT